MADREKVIATCEWAIKQTAPMIIEPKTFFKEILALLKEQEAKKVTWRVGRAHCPSCGELFPKKQDKQYIRFCNYCGQAVKWE